jgi:hypothetical protein
MLHTAMPSCFRSRIVLLPALALAFALSACSFGSRPDPEALISQSIRVTQSLQSVKFTAKASVDFWSLQMSVSGSLTASGAMADAGRTIQAHIVFEGEAGAGDLKDTATVSADINQTSLGDTDLRLNQATGAAIDVLLPGAMKAQWLGHWVRVVHGSTGTVVTPEPQVLDAQAAALKFVKDLGETSVGGTKAEHYAVAIDPEKLRAYLVRSATNRGETVTAEELDREISGANATGELWIDPKTARVLQVHWVVLKSKQTPLSFDLTIKLFGHNEGVTADQPSDVEEVDDASSAAAAASASTDSSASDSSAGDDASTSSHA